MASPFTGAESLPVRKVTKHDPCGRSRFLCCDTMLMRGFAAKFKDVSLCPNLQLVVSGWFWMLT